MLENKAVVEQKCEQIIDTLIAIGTEGTNILLNMNIWDWSQGVGLYGIYKYYKYSGK
jgi:rhamnogalacturonyl hydrolase YesR